MKKILLLILCCLYLSGCKKTTVCISNYTSSYEKHSTIITIKSKGNTVISEEQFEDYETTNLQSANEKEDFKKSICRYDNDCKIARNGNHIITKNYFKCDLRSDPHKCNYDDTIKFYEDLNYTCTIED